MLQRWRQYTTNCRLTRHRGLLSPFEELQQVESHLLKVSLVKLREEIRRRSLDARIVASIHDAIWVESAQKEGSEVRGIMERVMTAAMSLSVPLHVDFETLYRGAGGTQSVSY
jgi:DNA polymerase family A